MRKLSKITELLKAALKQAHEELYQVSRLAKIFYNLTLRLVDHMLGERGAKGDGQDRSLLARYMVWC
jgi:hypothetical protein